MSPHLEPGDCVRFEYLADRFPSGVYEGHVLSIGARRIVIKSGKHRAYIEEPGQIIGIVSKNKPDRLHNMGEEFRFAGGLGQDPLEEL